jgi:hypothetical protein
MSLNARPNNKSGASLGDLVLGITKNLKRNTNCKPVLIFEPFYLKLVKFGKGQVCAVP